MSGSDLVVHHLFNSAFFRGGWKPHFVMPGCRTTTRPEDLTGADILMVHLPSMLSTNLAGDLASLRKMVPKRQVWIADSLESAANYPSLDDPDFMSLFDIEVSYRQSADVWAPYIPLEFEDQYTRRSWRPRNDRCCAFISSIWDQSGRQDYMRELAKHLRIDSYGKFMRNRSLLFDRGTASKLRTLRRYRFVLAFENSIAEDYVTEKFFEPLLTGCIPIYLGAPNIDEFAPGENCFVNVSDFEHPKDLADFMKELDPADYQRWRAAPLREAFREKTARLKVPQSDRLAAAIRAVRLQPSRA